MITITSKDKAFLIGMFNAAGGFATFVASTYLVGEVHGLAVVTIVLILYTSFLNRRVAALERELQVSHKRA